MSRLITAILAKDEADRDLPLVIQTCQQFSDAVLVLDDRSTDATPKIAKDLGCEVRGRSVLKDPAWGAESPARAELWAWLTEAAGDGWALICDADQVLVGDPRPFTLSWESNTVAFPLFDVWRDNEYRADGMWGGFRLARPWMVRPRLVPDGWTPEWSPRGLHCGHLPQNWPTLNAIITDTIWWRHLAYSTPDRRKAKHAQYLSKREHLTQHELAHAESILD